MQLHLNLKGTRKTRTQYVFGWTFDRNPDVLPVTPLYNFSRVVAGEASIVFSSVCLCVSVCPRKKLKKLTIIKW